MSVLTTNVIIAIVLRARYKYSKAVVILSEGDCGQVKRFNIKFHVVVNILSTLLLGASNLCMQLLAAPTRDEVDRAHRNGYWLDIGAGPKKRMADEIMGQRIERMSKPHLCKSMAAVRFMTGWADLMCKVK